MTQYDHSTLSLVELMKSVTFVEFLSGWQCSGYTSYLNKSLSVFYQLWANKLQWVTDKCQK